VDLLTQLEAPFAAKVSTALAALAAAGQTFRPYFARRDPVTQGRLWRQSRSRSVVTAEIERLTDIGCGFMAGCIVRAGACDGPWATDAVPGLSWHQWGLAIDCVLLDVGKPNWNAAAYSIYGEAGEKAGCYWGGHFGDNDHLQDSIDASPLGVLGTMLDLDSRLRTEWGPDLPQ
jgi:peptidoglycan L-alanyl-D-glutamate endopeptidase CwlK